MLSHLLELHPSGFIPALHEMRSAIGQGNIWKCVSKVKFQAIPAAASPPPHSLPKIFERLPLQAIGTGNGSRTATYYKFSPSPSFSGVASQSVNGVGAIPATPPNSHQLHQLSRSMSILQGLEGKTRDDDDGDDDIIHIGFASSHMGIAGNSTQGGRKTPTRRNRKVIDADIEAELAIELGRPPTVPTIPITQLENVPEEDNDEAAAGVEADDSTFLWHEVVAKPYIDQNTSKRMVIIQRNDVTNHICTTQ